MRAVVQRVSSANVVIDSKLHSQINTGLMVLLGVKDGDTKKEADYLASKVAGLRIFTDENDKMNLSVNDVDGEILVVSNFTLYGDCKKGKRPSFISAAVPNIANPLYEYFCEKLLSEGVKNVEKGVFGADMKVSITNDGPVTIILDTEEMMPKGKV